MQSTLLRNNSRRDSVRRVPQITSNCATRHLHVGPLGQTARVDDWVAQIERQLPLGMVGGEARSVPPPSLKGIVNQSGWVLVRMAKIKMIQEDKNFQLVVRLGDEGVLSCPGTKSSGLQDYFLLGLQGIKKIEGATLDIFVCATGGGSLEHRVQTKMKSFKSRASGFFKLGRADSQIKEQPVEDDPVLSIPLGSLIQTNNDCAHLTGCFYVNANENPGSPIVGEISLQIVTSSGAFALPSLEEQPAAPKITHEQYLTILDGRRWKRFFAVLKGRHLQLYDFQCHKKVAGIKMNWDSAAGIKMNWDSAAGIKMNWDSAAGVKVASNPAAGTKIGLNSAAGTRMNLDSAVKTKSNLDPAAGARINLDSVVELEHVDKHVCGINNIFRVKFENGQEILAYSDDAAQGLKWADMVHRAVWNQPYSVTA